MIATINGQAANVGSATSVTLSYTDADNVAQTQTVSLTVNEDGSYSIAAFDLDALPLGNNATGSFTYDEDTQLQMPGRKEIFHHTDGNTLERIG